MVVTKFASGGLILPRGCDMLAGMMQKIILFNRMACIASCLLFLFIMPAIGHAESFADVRLISRLDFAPILLEMISHELQHQTGRQFSLTVQPVNASFSADLKSFLLIESGVPTIPQGFEKTGVSIRLVWGLAVRKSIAHLLENRQPDLETFSKILQELKKNDPTRFPWFESLLSNNTLRNFCLLFGRKTGPGNQTQPFWKQPCAASMLFKAIEAELLNPLSVEADLALAMEVFEAGDAMFVSQWVPECAFASRSEDLPALKDGIIIPFPLPRGKVLLPAITLHLMKPTGLEFAFRNDDSRHSETHQLELLSLDYASETAWIEKHGAENYDALIVGDL